MMQLGWYSLVVSIRNEISARACYFISKIYVYVRANPDSDKYITNLYTVDLPPPHDILCPETARSYFGEKSITHSPSTSTKNYAANRLLSAFEIVIQSWKWTSVWEQ